MSKGVLYVSTGKKFVDEAIESAKSLRKHLDAPIALATDQEVESELFDQVIKIKDPMYGFGDQISAMKLTPFDKTLCLDSDIYVYEDPSEIFDLLDRFDIGASHVPHWSPRDHGNDDNVPSSFPEYNSGVIVYKNTERVHQLLTDWNEEYIKDVESGYNRNQKSFRKVLYNSDLRIATLTPEYNCRFQFPERASMSVKIFHGRILDIDTKNGGMHKTANIERVAKKINSHTGPRVFYPKWNGIKVKSLNKSVLYRLTYSVRNDGIKQTVKKIHHTVTNKLKSKE